MIIKNINIFYNFINNILYFIISSFFNFRKIKLKIIKLKKR